MIYDRFPITIKQGKTCVIINLVADTDSDHVYVVCLSTC